MNTHTQISTLRKQAQVARDTAKEHALNVAMQLDHGNSAYAQMNGMWMMENMGIMQVKDTEANMLEMGLTSVGALGNIGDIQHKGGEQ